MTEFEDHKMRWTETFNNCPLGERMMTIYVDETYGAMSWLVLNLEVRQDTPIAQKALKFLADSQII